MENDNELQKLIGRQLELEQQLSTSELINLPEFCDSEYDDAVAELEDVKGRICDLRRKIELS